MPAVKPSSLPSDNPRVPVAKHPFRLCTEVQTRFSDIDSFGHINNNVYFAFFDLGKLDYFRTVCRPDMTLADIRAVVVNISCDFFQPSYFNEPLCVWTAITHVGERSYTIEQRIVNRDTLATKCIARTILAGFDPATAQSIAIDPEFVAAAEQFEQTKLTE